MTYKYPPIIPHFDKLLHGGDYNPDQWLDRPEILKEDLRLMQLAGCNTFSVGIFAWSTYEPREGEFNVDWMRDVLNRLDDAGHKVFLATPTGAKPAWMSRKYPEIRRINEQGLREPQRDRHNHCFSSPVYREKVAIINGLLAREFGQHPAVGGWHISNEYSGCCYCDHCISAFRDWLRERYGSLENLNRKWWTAFWSKGFSDWDDIEPRDGCIDSLALDWRRFTTWQTCRFMEQEITAVRQYSDKPVTTNMMGFFDGLDYYRIAELCDFIADDNYPAWTDADDKSDVAASVGMIHDLHRSMKQGCPFLLMESSPSTQNWMRYAHLKRPGVHRMQMIQALGHGADGTMYFQWRKGRGSCEKFHGAVVDHEGSENTRVFHDVAEVGSLLARAGEIRGTSVKAEAAVIFDWEVRWALETSSGPLHWSEKKYEATLNQHYKPFRMRGITTDIIESTVSFEGYKLIIAPMLYSLRQGVTERLKSFVEAGGTLVLTYLSGIVDSYNCCFTGGWPGNGLREFCGIRVEESDELTGQIEQSLTFIGSAPSRLSGTYAVETFCDLLHLEGAEMLATYDSDFYAGRPALTRNRVGRGQVFYIAARTGSDFLDHFYSWLLKDIELETTFPGTFDHGIMVNERHDGETRYFFAVNPLNRTASIKLSMPGLIDLFTGQEVGGEIVLPAHGSIILK